MSDTSLVFNILAKDKASKTFDKVKGAAIVAGAAIGAALTGGIAETLQKGKADALLAAQIGASPEMAASFGKISGQVYADNFGENVAEIDNALKGVWQNGLIPEDAADADIKRVTEKVLTMSAILQEDSDRVSAAVSQMLRTGMAGSAEEAFDVLTRATQQGVNKSQDLLDTINEYGTQFRKLGLTGPASMGLLSQAIRAGARDSDTAADALKEFSIRAVDGSKTSSDGFKMLGLNAKSMAHQIASGGSSAAAGLDLTLDRLRAIKDPVKQQAAAVALFGTKAEDLGKALFAMDPTHAVDALGQVKGAADKAGDSLSNSAGAKLDAFKRKVQGALIDKLSEAIPHIEATYRFLERNKDVVVPLAAALGTLGAAIYVLVVATRIYTAVQTALNIAMAMNPVGLVVAAVILLVAAFVLAYKKSETFRDIVNAVFRSSSLACLRMVDLFLAGVILIGKGLSHLPGKAGEMGRAIVSAATAARRKVDELAGAIERATRKRTPIVVSVDVSHASAAVRALQNRLESVVNRQYTAVIHGQFDYYGNAIPHRAGGGRVEAGMPYVVGERRPELFVPDRSGRIESSVSGGSDAGGGRGGVLTVRLDATGADNEFLRLLRKLVHIEGGGDVQVAFGR